MRHTQIEKFKNILLLLKGHKKLGYIYKMNKKTVPQIKNKKN